MSDDGNRNGLGAVGGFFALGAAQGLGSVKVIPEPEPQGSILARALREMNEVHNSPQIKHLAGVGERNPGDLSLEEVRSVCAALLRHIERATTGR